jgi:hypothetical protein
MALDAGLGRLNHAIKDLKARWDETRTRWTDSVARSFEDDHLAPLEQQVQATLRAMERLALDLRKARNECS